MLSKIEVFIERIELLEVKQAYQDAMLEEPNTTVILLQQDNIKLKEQLCLLTEKLKETATFNIASLAEETPPPHY